MRTVIRFCLLLPVCFVLAAHGAGPLRVGVHDKPPYAFTNPDGSWDGLGVFLWERVAHSLGVGFEYHELPFEDLIPGLASGKLDVVVGELLVNSDDEQQIDFSQPFLDTHVGVAVSARMWNPSWISILIYAFDWGILKVFFALVPALVLISILIWHAERKRNPVHFGGHPGRGLGSAFWFSTVTLTTTGYGDKVPVTFRGRLLAVVWMFVSLLLVTAYTASVASTVATVKSRALVRDVRDLRHYTNGVLTGSVSARLLEQTKAPIVEYEEYEQALQALAGGSIETVVGDTLSLEYLIQQQFRGKISLLPLQLLHSRVAFGVPRNSDFRKPLNVALLQEIQSPQWLGQLQKILGSIPVAPPAPGASPPQGNP